MMGKSFIVLCFFIGIIYAGHPLDGQACKDDSECLADGWETCVKSVC